MPGERVFGRESEKVHFFGLGRKGEGPLAWPGGLHDR